MSLVAYFLLSFKYTFFFVDKLVNLDCYCFYYCHVIIIHYYRICLLVLLVKLYRVLSTVGYLRYSLVII